MTHNHWSARFPYMVPVWHSLSQRDPSFNSANRIDPNLSTDFGGIGMYNNTVHRKNQRLIYKINKPTLPFYVSSVRTHNKQAGRNCLAFSSKRNILISCHRNQIHGLKIDIDQKRFEYDLDFNSDNPHLFSANQRTQTNPFCFHTDNIWNFKDKSKVSDHVLEIKLFETDRDLDAIAHCQRSLKMYKYCDESGEYEHLRLMKDINSSSVLFPFEKSLLDYCDRNEDMSEEFLSSFVNDSTIYRWNIEENKISIERAMNLNLSDNSNNLIGVEWAKTLNPFLYFYGTHNEIFQGDIRISPNGAQKPSLSIIKASHFTHFNQVEMFQTFLVNPLEAHQLVTSSDFNINFIDIRFPRKNLFQCKHMFTSNLANKLYSKLVYLGEHQKMLLISSNSERSCLYTFDSKTCIQPIMEHEPFYLNLPKELDSIFPVMENNNSFITGIQILPGKYNSDKPSNDFFTVAFLINNGDIYMQDFWPSDDTLSSDNSKSNFDENKHGNKNYYNTELDESIMRYMESVCKCIAHFKLQQKSSKRSLEENDNHLSSCLHNQHNFCICLRSSSEVEEELKLLDEDESEDEISLIGHETVDGTMKWSDCDPIDFSLFQDNWYSIAGRTDSNSGIRNICNPVTVSVCDRWFKKIKPEPDPPD